MKSDPSSIQKKDQQSNNTAPVQILGQLKKKKRIFKKGKNGVYIQTAKHSVALIVPKQKEGDLALKFPQLDNKFRNCQEDQLSQMIEDQCDEMKDQFQWTTVQKVPKQSNKSWYSPTQNEQEVFYCQSTTAANSLYLSKYPNLQANTQKQLNQDLIVKLKKFCRVCQSQVKQHLNRLFSQQKPKGGKGGGVQKKTFCDPNTQRSRYQIIAPCQTCLASFIKKLNNIFNQPLLVFKGVSQQVILSLLPGLLSHTNLMWGQSIPTESIKNMAKTGSNLLLFFFFDRYMDSYKFNLELKNSLSFEKNSNITRKIILRWSFNQVDMKYEPLPQNIATLESIFLASEIMNKVVKGKTQMSKQKWFLLKAQIQQFHTQLQEYIFSDWPAIPYTKEVIPPKNAPQPVHNVIAPFNAQASIFEI